MSTPMVINHEGRIDYTVTNSGGIPATVTFHLDGTSSGTTSLPVFWAATSDQSRTCTFPPWTLPVTCTRQLASGASWRITLEALAYTPGTLDLDASITTEGANDDPADDHLSATISTQCSIIGTTGNDVISIPSGGSACGNGGNDVYIPHGDHTAVFGGAGNDTVYGEHGNARYWLGAGTDTLSLARSRNPVHICAKPSGRWTADGDVSPRDGGAWRYGAEIIVGTPYGDIIKGNRHDDIIFGGGGRDIINPGTGDDAVFAGRGDDRIISRDGRHDDIVGGTGYDRAKADKADDVTSAATSYSRQFFDVACTG
jgi:Ca2+-binding RTX toxin-like protein